MRLENRTILITGGGSGIGRGLAEALLERGNRVIIAGRDEAKLATVCAAHPAMLSVRLDVSDAEAVTRMAADLIARHPTLDMLINAAGVSYDDDLSRPIDDAMLQQTLATNVLGPIRLTSALIEHFKGRPEATIVHVSSMLAFRPFAAIGIYSASKAALHAFALAQRYSLRNSAVEVIDLMPPLVATALAGEALMSRAMPVDDFVAETMARLEAGDAEILVETARTRREAMTKDEVADVMRFNDLMTG